MKPAVTYSLAGALMLLFCTGMLSLSRQAREDRGRIVCNSLQVRFTDSLQFVSEQDVRDYLDAHYGPFVGQRQDSVGLARIEDVLESSSAVMRCEAWTTDDGVLHLDITQRAPVLRFMNGSRGFYVDEGGYIFPLHDSFTADVPTVEGAIPVDIPDGFKGRAQSDFERAWIDGVLEMNAYIAGSRSWQRNIRHIRVRPNGDLLLTLEGRSEEFIVGQPVDIPDKLLRIDRYLGYIAPVHAEGYYKTVNVKYNQQIICRQKDT